MIDEAEVRRRERVAYQMGVEEAKAAIFDDLRNLAGNFALLRRELRELREALNLSPLLDDDECDLAATLQ